MKKTSYIFILFALMLSCNVIDQDPISDFSQRSFWQNPDDARAGIIAVYDGLQEALGSESSNLIIFGDARADEFVVGSGGSNRTNEPQFVNNSLNPLNPYTSWERFYVTINRANLVLQLVPEIQDTRLTTTERNTIVGEAHFVRALCYFYLVRIWGDVPLITEAYTLPTQQFNVPRAPSPDVYATILSDLDEASRLLPKLPNVTINENYRSRASIWSVRALRVDVALTLGWLQNTASYFKQAADTASLIINSNQFPLESNYTKLFQVNDQTIAPRNSSEVIFQLNYNVFNNETNSISRLFLVASGGGVNAFAPTVKLLNIFEPGDLRDTVTVTADRIIKYRGSANPTSPTATQRVHDNNLYIYRLSDIHLMRAEALVKLGQVPMAMQDVQKIRQRAWTTINNQARTPVALPAAPDENQAIKIILDERLREFAAEGKRWFDLVRTNRVLTELNNKITDPRNIVFPIFQDEIRLNSELVQNEYYR